MSDDEAILYRQLREKVITSPLSEVLPQLLLLAKDLELQELERWTQLELRGYLATNPAMTDQIVVPEYRSVSGLWYDDFGQPLMIRDDVELSRMFHLYRLRHGVADLEGYRRADGVHSILDQVFPPLIRQHLNVDVTHFRFHSRDVAGVLSEIRSRAVEWLAKIKNRVTQTQDSTKAPATPSLNAPSALRPFPSEDALTMTRRIGVMIGSPGDAAEERRAITDSILRWNATHGGEKGILLEAVKWETHSIPGLQGRPQGMINDELIPKSNCLIAIFRGRAGTPTGVEASGTMEEIREFMKLGKYVAVYFYTGQVPLASIDPEQLKTLNDFKKEIRNHGLTGDYATLSDLSAQLAFHLTSIIAKVALPRQLTIERCDDSVGQADPTTATKTLAMSGTPLVAKAKLPISTGTQDSLEPSRVRAYLRIPLIRTLVQRPASARAWGIYAVCILLLVLAVALWWRHLVRLSSGPKDANGPNSDSSPGGQVLSYFQEQPPSTPTVSASTSSTDHVVASSVDQERKAVDILTDKKLEQNSTIEWSLSVIVSGKFKPSGLHWAVEVSDDKGKLGESDVGLSWTALTKSGPNGFPVPRSELEVVFTLSRQPEGTVHVRVVPHSPGEDDWLGTMEFAIVQDGKRNQRGLIRLRNRGSSRIQAASVDLH